MTPAALTSHVWLLRGIIQSLQGILRLRDGRISFTSTDGERVFEGAVSQLTDIDFPWYYFGGGMKLTLRGERYRVSFMRPGNRGGRLRDMAEGLQIGKQWKVALGVSRGR